MFYIKVLQNNYTAYLPKLPPFFFRTETKHFKLINNLKPSPGKKRIKATNQFIN